MSEANTIARPYVQAAFEVAQKQGDLKGWSEMLKVLSSLMSNEEIRAVVASPRVKSGQIEELMLQLAGSLNKEQGNFVRILVQGGRLNVVHEIADLFEELRAEAEKSAQVTVTSAFELGAEQQEKIAAALKARLGTEVKLSCTVDKGLLGGIVIRMGDKVIDGSANTRLAEMAYALA